MKKKNKLMIASGIFAILSGVISIISLIVALTVDFKKMFTDLGMTDLIEYFQYTTFDYITIGLEIAVGLGFGIALICIAALNKKADNRFLTVATILMFLFSSLVAAIILMFAIFNQGEARSYTPITDPSQNIGQNPTENPEQKTDPSKELEEKVRRLKRLRDNGSITEEEYNRLLTALFK